MDYPKPSVTVDIVVFYKDKVLLIKRKNEPFKGKLALPGGFVDPNESPFRSACRELREETGIRVHPILLGVYGDKGRDPRGWTISIAYWGEMHVVQSLVGGDDALNPKFYDFNKIRMSDRLAFDHSDIIFDAIGAREIASYAR